MWDITAQPPAIQYSITATGNVRHIEVKNSTVFWSVDEPLAVQSGLPVGLIYMMQPDGTPLAIQVHRYFIYIIIVLILIYSILYIQRDHNSCPAHILWEKSVTLK